MTDVNQTLQGVGTQTVDSLKPKEKTRIAFWNVRTLYQTGKLAQVVREFENYGLDILKSVKPVGQGRDREHKHLDIPFYVRADWMANTQKDLP